MTAVNLMEEITFSKADQKNRILVADIVVLTKLSLFCQSWHYSTRHVRTVCPETVQEYT